MEKRQYAYEGAIQEFDKIVAYKWRGSTWAVSPAKAKSNLAYQFKRETNRVASCKVSLPGKLMEVV